MRNAQKKALLALCIILWAPQSAAASEQKKPDRVGILSTATTYLRDLWSGTRKKPAAPAQPSANKPSDTPKTSPATPSQEEREPASSDEKPATEQPKEPSESAKKLAQLTILLQTYWKQGKEFADPYWVKGKNATLTAWDNVKKRPFVIKLLGTKPTEAAKPSEEPEPSEATEPAEKPQASPTEILPATQDQLAQTSSSEQTPTDPALQNTDSTLPANTTKPQTSKNYWAIAQAKGSEWGKYLAARARQELRKQSKPAPAKKIDPTPPAQPATPDANPQEAETTPQPAEKKETPLEAYKRVIEENRLAQIEARKAAQLAWEGKKTRDKYGLFGFEDFNRGKGLDSDAFLKLEQGIDPYRYFEQRKKIKDKPDEIKAKPVADTDLVIAREGGVPSTAVSRWLTSTLGLDETFFTAQGLVTNMTLPFMAGMFKNHISERLPTLPPPDAADTSYSAKARRKAIEIAGFKNVLLVALCYLMEQCRRHGGLAAGLRNSTIEDPLFAPTVTSLTYRKILAPVLKELARKTGIYKAISNLPSWPIKIGKFKLFEISPRGIADKIGIILQAAPYLFLAGQLLEAMNNSTKILLEVKKELAENANATGLRESKTVPHEMRGYKYLVLDSAGQKGASQLLGLTAAGIYASMYGFGGNVDIQKFFSNASYAKREMDGFRLFLALELCACILPTASISYFASPRVYLLTSDLGYLTEKTRNKLLQQANSERSLKTALLGYLAGSTYRVSKEPCTQALNFAKLKISEARKRATRDQLILTRWATRFGFRTPAEKQLLQTAFRKSIAGKNLDVDTLNQCALKEALEILFKQLKISELILQTKTIDIHRVLHGLDIPGGLYGESPLREHYKPILIANAA